MARQVRRGRLRNARRSVSTRRMGGIDLQGRQDLPVCHELAGDRPAPFAAIKQEILGVKTLSGGEARVSDNADGIEVDMPVEERDAIATVIELTVSGRAYRHRTTPRDAAARFARLRSTDDGVQCVSAMRQSTAQRARRMTTRRRAGPRTDGIRTAELEVDLAEASTIERVAIEEPAEYQRIKSFEIEGFDGQDWHLVCQGNEVGTQWSRTVDARHCDAGAIESLGCHGRSDNFGVSGVRAIP